MMNRGLGSIMGYRGSGMPVARFQEGGFTDADPGYVSYADLDKIVDFKQVAQHFANNPGLSENQIAQVMPGLLPFHALPAHDDSNAAAENDPNLIPGIPTFARQTPSVATFAPLRRGLAQARQTPSAATFAPLRRGLAQLRPAAFMPGLTSGQAPADVAYQMDVGGVSPAEPRGLPEDFVLQTGAYGAATPTFLNRPATTTRFPGQTNATANQPGSLGSLGDVGDVGSGDGGGITEGDPNSPGFDLADALGTIAGYVGHAFGGEQDAAPVETGSFPGYGLGSGYVSVDDSNAAADYAAANAMGFGGDGAGDGAGAGAGDGESATGDGTGADSDGGPGGAGTAGGGGDPSADNGDYAKGGLTKMAEGGLASVAQNLADKGRKGDSMLVHMTPDEVAGLQALAQQMGGSLTINPQTGLPEANLFKKLLPMALGFALGPAGFGVFQSAVGAGLAVGAGYTLATGSLQQGISAGLSAYGGSNLGTGLQAAGTAGTAGADVAVGQAAANQAATDSAANVAGNLGGEAAKSALVESQLGSGPMITPTGDVSLASSYSGPMSAELEPFMQGDPGVSPTFDSNKLLPVSQQRTAYGVSTAPSTPPTPGSALTGAERFLGDKATRDLAAERYAAETGSTLGTSAMQIVGGAAGQSAADAEQRIKAEQAAIFAKKEERKRRFEELFGRTLGAMPARSGGLMKLAGGGMTYMEAGGTTGSTGVPRDVTGTGDGMSDSVPATIEGVQEARLADGEFVIPADVVADIGNGSSDAGSKKLYDMMDRIRKARHGTTEQPPEIQAERLMPA